MEFYDNGCPLRWQCCTKNEGISSISLQGGLDEECEKRIEIRGRNGAEVHKHTTTELNSYVGMHNFLWIAHGNPCRSVRFLKESDE